MARVWTVQDVQNPIDNRIEESSTLEYKRELGKNNKDIAKAVSAFANSDCGAIIYGVVERRGIPTDINWIAGENIKERIQNIVDTSVHPKLDGLDVSRILNPLDSNEAVYVANVTKSSDAPHMVDNRYYKRRGLTSTPMDHDEVKSAMVGAGRSSSLRFEMSENLKLVKAVLEFSDRIYQNDSTYRLRMVFVPLHTDAWNSVVSSGLLTSFPARVTEALVEVYAAIHDVNALMDAANIGGEVLIHTQVETSSYEPHGKYILAIIRDKIQVMGGQLGILLEHSF